jgi:hypothetical protein
LLEELDDVASLVVLLECPNISGNCKGEAGVVVAHESEESLSVINGSFA